METFLVAMLIPLIKKLIDTIRYARARDLNGLITQFVVWTAASLVVVLASKTSYAALFAFGDFSLATTNLWSQIFLGLLLGSSASLTQDLFKSIDNRNTSAIPTLLPAKGEVPELSELPTDTTVG